MTGNGTKNGRGWRGFFSFTWRFVLVVVVTLAVLISIPPLRHLVPAFLGRHWSSVLCVLAIADVVLGICYQYLRNFVAKASRRLLSHVARCFISEPVHTSTVIVLVFGLAFALVSLFLPFLQVTSVKKDPDVVMDRLEVRIQSDAPESIGSGPSAGDKPQQLANKPITTQCNYVSSGATQSASTPMSTVFDWFPIRLLGLLFGIASAVAVVQVFHLTKQYEFRQMDPGTFLREIVNVVERTRPEPKGNTSLRYLCMVVDPMSWAVAGSMFARFGRALEDALATKGAIKKVAILNPWNSENQPAPGAQPRMPDCISPFGQMLNQFSVKHWQLAQKDSEVVVGGLSAVAGKDEPTCDFDKTFLGLSPQQSGVGAALEFQTKSYNAFWHLLCKGRVVVQSEREADLILYLYERPDNASSAEIIYDGDDPKSFSGFPNANLFLTSNAGLFALWDFSLDQEHPFEIDGLPLRNPTFVREMGRHFDNMVESKRFKPLYLAMARKPPGGIRAVGAPPASRQDEGTTPSA